MLCGRAVVHRALPPLTRSLRTKSTPTTSKSTSKSTPLVQSGSTQHHDLTSFLKYAESNDLSKTSTVYVGTLYEYTAIESLKRFGFDLTRTGKASDLGIDLLGHWSVPSLPVPLRTLVQCKARSKKLHPENVRELEGAFSGAPAGWRGEGVLGFLVAAESATKGMRDALVRSKWPLGFMQVNRNGVVEQFLWNHSAAERGLEGMGVTAKYSLANSARKKAAGGNEVVLTYNGWALTRGALDESQETPSKRKRARRSAAVNQGASEGAIKKKRGRPRKVDAV